MKQYLAVDLGAESGRLIAGAFDGTRITLEEVHRFANRPVHTPDGWHWDMLGLYRDTLEGLRHAGARYGEAVAGIGVDTWGVDYALLDDAGRLLGNPYTYRDPRTDGLPELAAQIVSPEEQYGHTGIAQIQINTLYQLMAAARSQDPALGAARTLLMIGDLVHFWLTGLPVCERTGASTSGALAVDGTWARGMVERLGVPARMLVDPIPAGVRLGALRGVVQQETGLTAVPVIVPATHDTACAVAAIPASERDGLLFISSGTWSLVGTELEEPVLSNAARLAGFSNERGATGNFTLHTNIMGLWFLQEARRAWVRRGDQHGTLPYEELLAAAAAIPSPDVVINLADPTFLHPDDMIAAIGTTLPEHARERVADPVCLARAILESLALVYRQAAAQVAALTGRPLRAIHIVGGGSRNGLLCQLTADATGLPVTAGPAEASAIGNVLLQALGAGELRSPSQVRALATASAEVRHYAARDQQPWAGRSERLQELQSLAPAR